VLVHSHDVYSSKALILCSAERMQFIIEVWCFSLNSQVGNTTLEYFSAAIPQTAVISFSLSPQASHIHYLISALYFPITSLLISRRREQLTNSPSLSEVATPPCFILCSHYCMSSLWHKKENYLYCYNLVSSTPNMQSPIDVKAQTSVSKYTTVALEKCIYKAHMEIFS